MKKIVILSLLVIIAILFAAQIRRGVLAGLIVLDAVREPEQAVLGRLIAAPAKEEVFVPSRGTRVAADLYVPRKKGPLVPLLLAHDAGASGRSDARTVLLASNLARAGFLVMVPDLGALRSFRLRTSDAEDLVQCFRFLQRHDRARSGGSLLGIGFGAGPLLLAAEDDRVNGQVGAIGLFGGYADLRAVLQFGLTGSFDYGGRSGQIRPDRAARWTLAYRNLDLIAGPADRDVMHGIVEKQFRLESREAALAARGLSPDGRAVYQFLRNSDPERFSPLYENLPTGLREYVRLLSPGRTVRSLKAELILVHATDDYSVPYTESLRLADGAGGEGRAHVALLPGFHEEGTADASGLFRRYGQGGVRFIGAVYRLLDRARI